MLSTWADGQAVVAAALAAQRAAPDDPRSLNVLALASLRLQGNDGAQAAWRLWSRAAEICPTYLPAVTNLVVLAAATPDRNLAAATRGELARQTGDLATAKASLQQAWKLAPTNSEKELICRKIDAIDRNVDF